MTIDNSTINRPASLTPERIKRMSGEICNLALSIADMCDNGINDPSQATPAQLVAIKAMARNVGALGDQVGGGEYMTDALEWLGGAG
ncbi:Uncharacterised protein [Halioglobus japonicus]|nr:Uncharacterised protein [Halioglobus japonicus]